MVTLKSKKHYTIDDYRYILEILSERLICVTDCSDCKHRLACEDITTLQEYCQRKINQDAVDC